MSGFSAIPPSPPEGRSPPPGPTFCPGCGTPVGGTVYCAACARLEPAEDALPTTETSNAGDTNKKSRRPGAESSPESRPASMLRSALLLYFALLGVIMAMTIAYAVMGESITPEWEVGADLITSGLFAAVVLGGVFPFRKAIIPLLTRLGPPAWLVAAPFIAAATCFLASMIVNAINAMFSVEPETYSDPFTLSGYGIWLPLITIAVCPAIFEELAFRGVINTALDGVLDAREAALVTALLFAILHLSILSLPHLLVMGLMLGFIRHRAKSLYPCMLLHFCHNAYVVILEHLNT